MMGVDASAFAAIPLPGSSVPVGDGTQPHISAVVDPAWIQASPAEIGPTKPPALAPGLARAQSKEPVRGMLDRFFVEPQNGWLWDRSVDELGWFGL
jgi:hypothetical protein